MLTRVHHIGLVVRHLDEGLALWRNTFGLRIAKRATVQDQGVTAALLPIGRSEIELLEPIDPAGGVARFLERRGEGLHHVCFETPDVAAELEAARAHGLPLLDQAPRLGLAGMICFLHPKGTHGVLVEFATPLPGEPAHASAGSGALGEVALREVTARSRDPASAAALFATRLGLAPASTTADLGATAAAVEVGGVRLRFVAPDPGSAGPATAALRTGLEASGEGLAALVLEVDDLEAAADALADLGPARESGGLRLPAERCHGVPLTVLRAS
jgi:methylmalonyl-CoA/ethylmalonyl-CoA epimerase